MGWGHEGDALILQFFSNLPPPTKSDAPHGAHPPLKNEPPPPPQSEKQSPLLPLKREAPFHKMIPRKSTIINNLKSS